MSDYVDGDNQPIFIIGSYRSGTSVLTWCLGQHPNILPLPETHWIARLSVDMDLLYKKGTYHGRYTHLGALDWGWEDFYGAFGKAIDQFVVNTREPRLRFIRKHSAKRLGISLEELEERLVSPDPDVVTAQNYMVVRSKEDPKRRWVDGTPENTFYVYSLSRMFPNAKFIHILRNPESVAASLMKFSQAGGAGRDYEVTEAFATWHRLVSRAVLAEKALGSRAVMRINYEDLISDPRTVVSGLLDFVGEEFCEDCLLPLKEKINSSNVKENDLDRALIESGGESEKRYYTEIRSDARDDVDPDPIALASLEDHFRRYLERLYVNNG